MRKVQQGFTPIELMVVAAIIGFLAAVAIPAYKGYTINSADRACLAEAKAYANFSLARMADGAAAGPLPAPILSACHELTQAVNYGTDLVGKHPVSGCGRNQLRYGHGQVQPDT